MSFASVVARVATTLDTVSGLHAQTNLGKLNRTPGAVVECDSAQGPSSFDGARDYVIRVGLCVQVGDYRDSIDRIYALAESCVDALEADGLLGPWRFEVGTLDFGGQHYGGGVLAVQVVE
jgi:hypothetical protein